MLNIKCFLFFPRSILSIFVLFFFEGLLSIAKFFFAAEGKIALEKAILKINLTFAFLIASIRKTSLKTTSKIPFQIHLF